MATVVKVYVSRAMFKDRFPILVANDRMEARRQIKTLQIRKPIVTIQGSRRREAN